MKLVVRLGAVAFHAPAQRPLLGRSTAEEATGAIVAEMRTTKPARVTAMRVMSMTLRLAATRGQVGLGDRHACERVGHSPSVQFSSAAAYGLAAAGCVRTQISRCEATCAAALFQISACPSRNSRP
jgi:hypothetical protein